MINFVFINILAGFDAENITVTLPEFMSLSRDGDLPFIDISVESKQGKPRLCNRNAAFFIYSPLTQLYKHKKLYFVKLNASFRFSIHYKLSHF